MGTPMPPSNVRERQALVLGPCREQIDAASAQVQRAQALLKCRSQLTRDQRQSRNCICVGLVERAKANLALIETQIADTTAVSLLTELCW
jgi:hypothetical protein